MTPRQYLKRLGKPYVTLVDCARALDLHPQALYARVRALPKEEQPENLGAFRAGSYVTFVNDIAADWCERHQAWWRANKL